MSFTNESWTNRQDATPEDRRDYERERLILWTLDSLAGQMERNRLTKADIARSLGTSRSHITQLFSGTRNATLGTIAELAWACGQRAVVKFEPLRHGKFITSPVNLVELDNIVPIRQRATWVGNEQTEYTDAEVCAR